jgi:hypothetical protein
VPQQTVQAQRGEKAEHGVDLRLSCLPCELERQQQQQRAREGDLAPPGSAQQVVHQQHRADSSQQRGQQEARPQRPRGRHGSGHQPEIQRRLVCVQVAADTWDQPLAAPQHVACDQGEARLIGGPGVAQAEPRRHQQQGQCHDARDVQQDVP